MKNIYNFNIAVVTPEKTPNEQKLFEKWKPILRRSIISDELIEQYKKDLLTLTTVLLFTTLSFGQTVIVPAGNDKETFGEVFPLMQQLDTIEKEVSLGVPKYEIETPKPIIKKKLTIFEKVMNFFKRIFNTK